MTTRILLVDDDQKIVSLLKRGLTYEGFEVYTAPDGESGLAAATAAEFKHLQQEVPPAATSAPAYEIRSAST